MRTGGGCRTVDRENANAPSRHRTQYFEMMGDHALYHDGWILSTKVMRPPWDVAGAVSQNPAGYPYELYDLSKDWTQYDNVAARISKVATSRPSARAQRTFLACCLIPWSALMSPMFLTGEPAKAMQDLIAGRVDYMCNATSISVEQIKATTLKPIALLSPRRNPALPKIATAGEQGLK